MRQICLGGSQEGKEKSARPENEKKKKKNKNRSLLFSLFRLPNWDFSSRIVKFCFSEASVAAEPVSSFLVTE